MLWFSNNQRQLPWRENRDPYRIWISEVMLQQTQVETVIPYFKKFLRAFPTMKHLAQASEDEVFRLWQGLGYYRRASALHRAAKIIWQRHGPVFPSMPADLQGIPGLGRYTRNAILSQAFDLPLPIVEANSKRVLARFFAWKAPLDSTQSGKFLWDAAEKVLPRENPGQFNQALMELGALVCTKNPDCGSCPLAGQCLARIRGLQNQIPAVKKKPKPLAVREAAIVLVSRGKVLIGRRPDGGRWERMWEIPHGELGEKENASSAAERIARDLTGIRPGKPEAIGKHRHAVTRYRIDVELFQAAAKGKSRLGFYQEFAWVHYEELQAYAMGSAQRRLLSMWHQRHNGME